MRKVESRDPRTPRDPDDRLIGDELRERDRPADADHPHRSDPPLARRPRDENDDGAADIAEPGLEPPLAEHAHHEGPIELFDDTARGELRSRWESIQAGFVDEPRRSVEEADRLVTEATERLAEGFARVRDDLEDEWRRGEDVSTEDLRLALRRYRSFFDRLVST